MRQEIRNYINENRMEVGEVGMGRELVGSFYIGCILKNYYFKFNVVSFFWCLLNVIHGSAEPLMNIIVPQLLFFLTVFDCNGTLV